MTFPSLRKLLFVVPAFVAAGVAAACSPYIGPLLPAPPAGSPSDQPAPQAAQCPSASTPEKPKSSYPRRTGSWQDGDWTPAPKSVVWPSYPSKVPTSQTPGPQLSSDAPIDRSPVTHYYQPATNAQGQTTYILRTAETPLPSGSAGTVLSVADGKLHLQGVDGSRSACEKLEILIKGNEPIQVAVVAQEPVRQATVHKSSDGSCYSGKLVLLSKPCLQLTSGKEDGKCTDFLKATAEKVRRTGPDGATLVLEGAVKLTCVRSGKKIDVSTDLLSVNLLTGQVISELNAPKAATSGNPYFDSLQDAPSPPASPRP